MFSQLPKLFDRNFAIGFFMPVMIFIGANALIFIDYEIFDDTYKFMSTDLIVGTTIVGLVTWLGGMLLLALNRELTRFLEGYGRYNPLQLIRKCEENYYDKLVTECEELKEKCKDYEKSEGGIPQEITKKYSDVLRKLSERFPDDKQWILATSFGNTIRAFEIYPRVMYGIEGIQGWTRLLAIMPSDFLELINSSRALVNFWMNLFYLSAIYLIETTFLIIYKKPLIAHEPLLVGILVLVISYPRACSAASRWGEYVKSAFDVFLPKLLTVLGETSADIKDQDREFWTAISWGMIYRRPFTSNLTEHTQEEE